MPIVVDEVVISVEVTNRASGGGSSAPASGTEHKQAVVAECVERVLEILRELRER
jgi:hypothetical protein